MIGMNVSVTGMQSVIAALRKEIAKLTAGKGVLVGIHESDSGRDADEITNASLGAVLHFGADINHPGGTEYGYATKRDEKKKRVRFLKKGTGHKVIGTTGPHQIKIPARPWLDVGVAKASDEYVEIFKEGAKKNWPAEKILNQVGSVAAASAQEFMVDLKTPPNAPSTIRKKGSSNPLVDTGALKQSVTYSITESLPQEGLQ